MRRFDVKAVTHGESPKAMLIRFKNENVQWVPKRFCTFTPKEGSHLVGDIPGTLLMPKWLAKRMKI